MTVFPREDQSRVQAFGSPSLATPEQDSYFWVKAGFFSPPGLRYISDPPNEPTRVACKCVLVDCLCGVVAGPPEDAHWDQPSARNWFGAYVHQVLCKAGAFPLEEALLRVAREQSGGVLRPEKAGETEL